MNSLSWTHFNPVTIVYQPGGLARLAEYIDAQRAVLVTTPGSRRRGLVARIETALGQRLVSVLDAVKPNPDIKDVQQQGDSLRAQDPDLIIAVGGGSAIDTGKALARLLALPAGSRLADLFVAHAGHVDAAALPVVAIPTTAGTGAEVTPFSTVWDYDNKKKCSVVGDDLYPRLALLDPELTLDLPETVTVSSGLDAISHALESAWNRNANTLSLGIVTRSLQLSLRALPRLRSDPGDREARAEMLQASTLAGLAISQTRTALAHGVSYPLTANFNLPHGIACSFTLPALLEFNAREDDGRLDELSRNLGYAGPAGLAQGLSALLDRLGASRQLATHLPERAAVMALAEQMFAPGRSENNLREATTDDVRALVLRSLDALGV